MDKNKTAMVNALRSLAEKIEYNKVTILESKVEKNSNYWNIGYKEGQFISGMEKIEIAYIDNDKQL